MSVLLKFLASLVTQLVADWRRDKKLEELGWTKAELSAQEELAKQSKELNDAADNARARGRAANVERLRDFRDSSKH